MISEEHFAAVRAIHAQARELTLACTAIAGTSSLLHMAFDPELVEKFTRAEQALARKLGAVK